MRSHLLVWGVAALAAQAAAAAPVSFDLASAANKDVVCEAKLHPKAAAFGENSAGIQAFVEDGYTDMKVEARGLPRTRKIGSNEPGLGQYVLLPYDGPNVIELATQADAKPQRYEIDVPDAKYRKIGILASAVDGDASFTVEFHYADGVVEAAWWEVDDWYDMGPRGNLKKVIRDMDRAVAKTGAVEKSGHFNVYEYVVDQERGLDPEKVLDRIVVGNSPNRWPDTEKRWGAVFAINGETAE